MVYWWDGDRYSMPIHFFPGRNCFLYCSYDYHDACAVNLFLSLTQASKSKSLNYLAHAYLSFNDPGILLGNMISDFVKGRKKFDFPVKVQQGITLHRIIDTYTDTHEATKEAKEIFRPVYRLYSGAIIDVLYDHFLALDPEEFTDTALMEFSQVVYHDLAIQGEWHPPGFSRMFPYMRSQNWLYHYRTLQGTKNSLAGLIHRAAYLSDSQPAADLFEEHYQPLKLCYRQFWQDLKPFARRQFEIVSGI